MLSAKGIAISDGKTYSFFHIASAQSLRAMPWDTDDFAKNERDQPSAVTGSQRSMGEPATDPGIVTQPRCCQRVVNAKEETHMRGLTEGDRVGF